MAFDLICLKAIAYILSLLIASNAILARKITGIWLNPGTIFSSFWFVYTFLPLVIGWSIPVNPLAILYIYIFNLFFVISSVPFKWKSAVRVNSLKPDAFFVFRGKIFLVVFYSLSAVAIVANVIGMMQQGFNFSWGKNIFELAGSYAATRYGEGLDSNIFTKIGLLASYPSAIFGGFLWGVSKKGLPRFLVLIMSFMPTIFVMVFQSAKGMFFLSLALFSGSLLIIKIYNKDYELISFRLFLKIFMWSFVLFALSVVSFMARGLYLLDFSDVVDRLILYFVSYSSGHLYAFSDWFNHRYSYTNVREELTFGFYTFMSFFQLLGDDRFIAMGYYDDFFYYGGILKSNIYTVFRGIILDFGLLGSFVFSFFVGNLIHASFYLLLMKKLNVTLICLFIYFVAFAYQSYLISSFTWLVVPASFLLTVFLLTLCFVQIRITKNV